jgi:hypothetical protein
VAPYTEYVMGQSRAVLSPGVRTMVRRSEDRPAANLLGTFNGLILSPRHFSGYQLREKRSSLIIGLQHYRLGIQ